MQGVHCEELARPVWLENVPDGHFVGVCVPENVQLLKIGTPEKFAIITRKFEQGGFTIE